MKTLSFVIVGCGAIAHKHAVTLQSHLDGADLIGICDLNPEVAEAMGQKYQVPWFTDMHHMMDTLGNQVDVVSVLTPSGYHAENVLDLVKYGKHLCVEKPMALNLEDAQAMISACEQAKICLFVVHQNRFNIPIRKVKAALEQGRLGKIITASMRLRWHRPQSYYAQAEWRGTMALDGGVFANQAYHFLDLLQWLVGEISHVSSFGKTQLANIEAEDTGMALLHFRNGALGMAEATTAALQSAQESSISLLGESGIVEIGGFAANEIQRWEFLQPHPDDQNIQQTAHNPPGLREYGHIQYLTSVVDTLTQGTASAVDGHEALKSLKVVSAIYEAITTQKLIAVDAVHHHSKLGIPGTVTPSITNKVLAS